MKLFIALLIASLLLNLLLISCNQTTSSSEAENTDSTFTIPFPEKYTGLYFTETYVNELLSSRSPRKAQNLAYFSGLIFYARNDSAFVNMDFNHHEGGWEIPVLMTEKSAGYALNLTENSPDFKIQFNEDGSVWIDDDEWKGKMIKVQEKPELNLIDESVNHILFPTAFHFNDEIIRFHENGKLSGIDSLASYYVYLDYFGPGMNLDMIEFSNKYDANLTYTYGFEFTDSSLQLFELQCIELDFDLCLEHTKGNIILELKY
jgi:hypothetical protein